ncbi:hypothetical protein HPB49_011493 [Dermacentor silvarum]|uniref:Uncharacterized protein n=1 Tax=Dermacentor silvarum TaxID=543639 RepID=A0ACB8CWZ7_DERSI|nr:hypothetical protein HPB49_011493 [Dermacentor silvarum]
MQPSQLAAKPADADDASSQIDANRPGSPPAQRGPIRQAPPERKPRSATQRPRHDDWSPLYELESVSSHSPPSTSSQETPRDTSVSSLPSDAESKPIVSGTPQSRTATREKRSRAHEQDFRTSTSTGETKLSPASERSPGGSPPFVFHDNLAKPTSTVTFSSETKTTQSIPACASDYPISILKKPAEGSSSSSESPIKSPPSESSDSPTNPAPTKDELRRFTKLRERGSHAKETSVDATRAPIKRSRIAERPSNLPFRATTHHDVEVTRSASPALLKSPVGPLATADPQSTNVYQGIEPVANKMGTQPGATKRSELLFESSTGAGEEESGNLSPPIAIREPSRNGTKWTRLFIEPSNRRRYWETLTESDTGTMVCAEPKGSSAMALPSGSAPEIGSAPKAVDQGVEPDSRAGTLKKVLLVSASADPAIDLAIAAPEGHYGGTNVIGLDSYESSSSATEAEVVSQVSTQIHFRPVPPEESSEFRRKLARQKGGEERGMTTLWKTSTVGRFTTTMSTAFRDIIVMAMTRRFFMLIIFCAATIMPAFQWIQYSIVSNIAEQYYNVSSTAVSWTAMIYYVAYIIMAIPCAWILDSYGLRVTVLCGACGSAIGSCIKLFSIGPDRFAIVLIGQAFPALATAFTSAVPARLASAWFKYEEITTASSAGMLGVQLGTALGFFAPPNVLDKNDIEGSLRTLCIGVATASCLAFLVAIACFEEKPVHPPSFSEMLNRFADTRVSFGEGMHALIKDRDFVLLLLSYGINTGGFYSISTLLNPVITSYFPGEESFAGLLGLSMIFSGLLGSWVGGVILDKTAMFKEVTLAAYIFSTMAMLLHTFVLPVHSHALTIVVCVFLGFFLTGYMPLAVQLSAEITYPLNEALPASLLSMSAQGTSLILTPICSFVIAKFGHVASNLVITGMLVIGCLMTVTLRAELKRQKAFMRVQRKRSITVPRSESVRARSSPSEELDAETERSKDTTPSA